MDPVRNPFAPGAGSPPPELAGRDEIIDSATIALQRTILGRHAKSQILLGLRGTGKTVLLNKIEQLAESFGHMTSFAEAPDNGSLLATLYPKIVQILRKLSVIQSAKAHAHSAMRALKGIIGTISLSVGDMTLKVDPEPGTADSGILEIDLCELFIRIGEAARSAGKGWTLLIDEVQYLTSTELSALIAAIHRVNQRQLPIMFFGAGLPQIARLSGDAKSYAERLFDFPDIGPLNPRSAAEAIRQPIENEGETIEKKALSVIITRAQGYPYFLQEWGYQAWNISGASPISESDVMRAHGKVMRRLDEGFFRVRFDRLTPKEEEYVIAMAQLGKGPYRSSDVAENLGENVQSLGPRRSTIINKGMIYSPVHGEIAFTVPMFEDYLMRITT